MSPWDKLYLVTTWSYIISFHVTYAILTFGPKDMEALRILAAMD